ncbi:MAG: PEP-CTERM sorting domain-containing protein [Terriglobia bacterium]
MFPNTVSSLLCRKTLTLLVCLAGFQVSFAQLASSACPPDCPIMVQPITFDAATGKWIAVGDGPFKTDFPKGVAPDDPDFSGTRLDDTMFNSRPFGSVGASKGGPFKNLTGKKVGDIEITGVKGNSFKGSSAGGGWTATTGTDKDGNPTLTFTAPAGSELTQGQSLWMRVPKAEQPGSGTPTIFSGKLTPPPAPPPPGPAPQKPKPPSVKSGGDPVPKALSPTTPAITFNGTKLLTFSPAKITSADYTDGSAATSNSVTETIIGAQINIGQMLVLGRSSTIPGAFSLSDSFVQITNGSTTFLTATLADTFLMPDTSEPGFDTLLQASLVWDEESQGLGSKYLSEYFNDPDGSDLFFHTNLLTVTNGLTLGGQSGGAVEICSTIPEPSTVVLLGIGLLAVLGGGLRRSHAAGIT